MMSQETAPGVETAAAREGSHDFALPLDGATNGRLAFVHGATKVVLRADAALPHLCRAHFAGPLPTVEAQAGTVTIRYPRFAPIDWLRTGLLKDRHAVEIVLNATIPWTVAIDGGVAKLNADLRALRLGSVDLNGGATGFELALPAPVGIVPVRIGGGASNLTIHRPAGVPVRLQIKEGATRLALDDQRLGAVGGETRLTSRDDQDAPDRYEITIRGGASTLTIA